MNNEKVAQVIDAPTEPKTAKEWLAEIDRFDLALQAPNLDPVLETRIKEQRVYAVQRKFLAEITAPPVKVDAPAQEFVVPQVPTVMPPSVAESLAMWDAKIAEIENSLAHNPLPHFVPAYKDLLAEAKQKRERVLYDFQHPAPIPIPLPPIALPVEVVELVKQIVRAEVPSITAEILIWLQKNREWLRS
jgi:hypothetical protein